MMGMLARMRGLAARGSDGGGLGPVAGLGTSALAVRAGALAAAPAGSVLVEAGDGAAWFVHPAALRCTVTPFAAAPEIGLRIDYCFDPGGDKARFALLLAGESAPFLPTGAVAAAMQEAVQAALQMGTLELPPCTTDEEWHAFRAGLNELVYTRFGLVVEDCVPVDLHPAMDFAASLLAAADTAADATAAPAPPHARVPLPEPMPDGGPPAEAEVSKRAGAPAPAWLHAADVPVHCLRQAAAASGRNAAAADARAMRRLFLEIPALAAGLRALPMREGDGSFAPLQDMLRRLALAALSVNTMPALAHAAPGRRLPEQARQLRTAHGLAAQCALDEAWAWLASMRCGLDLARLDEADRILSNLEYSLAQRRASGTGATP